MPEGSLIVGALGAVFGVGGIAALVQARSMNRRTDAEAHKADATADVTIGGGWQMMWEAQRTDNNELRERIAVVEDREAECRSRLARLETHASPAEIERVVASMLADEIAKRKQAGG